MKPLFEGDNFAQELNMVWPSSIITLTFGKAFNIPLAKVSWLLSPPTALGVASSQEADLWCFFGIFENPQFLMHFFCSKNEELQKAPTKISLKKTQDFKKDVSGPPSPKGWPFSAQKNNHQMLRASDLDGKCINTVSMVRFAQDWPVGLLKDLNQQKQLARCWKLLRHRGSTSIL